MLTHAARKQTGILLVDDHPIVRLGFIALLRQVSDTYMFAEADDAARAVEIARVQEPAIALVDLSLAGALSLELIKQLRALEAAPAILVISMHDERHYAARVLRAGARGYVMKQVAAHAIGEAVQVVLRGGIWLSEDMRAELAGGGTSAGSGPVQGLHLLSDREVSVFRLIGEGMKKSEMARELGLSPNTIETYRSNIKNKMGIASGAELYRRAFLHFQDGLQSD